MNDEIEIVITPQAEITISVKNVKGASCKDVTAAIEKALGTVVDDTPTKEMYEKPKLVQHSNKH